MSRRTGVKLVDNLPLLLSKTDDLNNIPNLLYYELGTNRIIPEIFTVDNSDHYTTTH